MMKKPKVTNLTFAFTEEDMKLMSSLSCALEKTHGKMTRIAVVRWAIRNLASTIPVLKE